MFNRFESFYNSRKCGFVSSYYKKGVNFEYIATVSKKSQETEEVVYKPVPITLNYSEVLDKVQSLCKDEETTIHDIHDFCVKSIPNYSKRYGFYCCLPYEYSCAYIAKNTEHPRTFMYDIEDHEKYSEFIKELKNDFITKSLKEYSLGYAREHLTSKEHDAIYSSEETRKHWEETVSKKFKSVDELPVDEKSNRIKAELGDFEKKAQRQHKFMYADALKFWILAFCYFDTLDSLLEDKTICMYSLEDVGWHSYTYPVHGDFEFKVNTNFCYGTSSYFDIIIKYKGIKILPYSHIVSFYHANMVSFLSCTRKYDAYRQNWDSCLKYVVELINEAYLDESKFIEKWIKQELTIMIKGLKSIMDNPDKYLEHCLQHPLDENKKDKLVSVRNISEEEFSYYKIYRHEMTIAFQAEKITDSISVIDNLKQLSTVMPDVLSSIEIIKKLNKTAQPIFNDAMSSIALDIEKRNDKISECQKELKDVKNTCNMYVEECRNAWKNTNDRENLDFSEFEKNFIKNHKEYEENLNTKQKLMDSLEELKLDVEKRKSFKSKLKECTKKIDKFLAK